MRALRSAPSMMVLAATLACRSLAHAGELPKGTFELSPGLTFDRHNYTITQSLGPYGPFTDETQVTRLQVSADLGYCLTNHFELLAGLLLDHQIVDSSSGTDLGFSGAAQFNFTVGGGIVPFVRAGAGILTYSGAQSTSPLVPMLGAGIRMLVHSGASVNVGFAYQHEKSVFGYDNSSGDTFGLNLGVSIFPGSTIPIRGQ